MLPLERNFTSKGKYDFLKGNVEMKTGPRVGGSFTEKIKIGRICNIFLKTVYPTLSWGLLINVAAFGLKVSKEFYLQIVTLKMAVRWLNRWVCGWLDAFLTRLSVHDTILRTEEDGVYRFPYLLQEK